MCLICLRAGIVNGSSSDLSVHPENEIEYLIESNCLRQEKEEIVSAQKKNKWGQVASI